MYLIHQCVLFTAERLDLDMIQGSHSHEIPGNGLKLEKKNCFPGLEMVWNYVTILEKFWISDGRSDIKDNKYINLDSTLVKNQ